MADGKEKVKNLQAETRTLIATVFSGRLPTNEGLVKAACEQHPGESAETLLSFKVYPTKVVIVISTGQKYEYELADLLKHLARKIADKSSGPDNGRKR